MEVPSDEEYFEHLVMKAIDSYGYASIREILYLRKKDYTVLKKVIKKLIEENRIKEFIVEGSEEIYFTKSEILNKKFKEIEDKELHILNPFDNLIIQRERTKFLFDFDYVIECYVPAHKRKFGYYVLPVLYGDKFVGRIDAKADRKKKELVVYNYFRESGIKNEKEISFRESGIKNEKEISYKLKKYLDQFAIFTKCEKVKFL